MFDPFFPLVLIAGPLFLGWLVWIEATRRTRSIWPMPGTYVLGFIGAYGMSQWLNMLVVMRMGEGMTPAQFDRVVFLSFGASALLVAAIYVAVALLRRRQHGT